MKSVKRLYNELKPSHYELELTPDAKKLVFQGVVTIDLKKTGRPSQRLTFHQHGLVIDSADIIKHDKKGNSALSINRINNQNTLDEVRLHTDELVYAGDYTVTLRVSEGLDCPRLLPPTQRELPAGPMNQPVASFV